MNSSNRRISDDAVSQILKGMSVEDKIGQMSQIDIKQLLKEGTKELDKDKADYYIGKLGIGSVLNLIDDQNMNAEEYRKIAIQLQNITLKFNRIPLLWGLDSVHGANYIYRASLPPQPLNMAATFNRTVALEAGRLASRDTRAAGIAWLFSPLLGIALEPRWSRVYETFGEDPHVVGVMAQALIQGIQQVDPNNQAVPQRAAACAKHFVGYSKPINGHDRSPSWIPTRHLYQYFVPPWKKVAAEVMTVMESYTETDGVPNVANPKSTNYLLRQRLGFQGVLVTDYEEIFNLKNWHHTAGDTVAATIQSLRHSSVDMSMIPYDAEGFAGAVRAGLSSNELLERRLDTSVERILRLKLDDLKMADHTLTMNDPNLKLVGTDGQRMLEVTTESMVLTKNDAGILPLGNGQKILVTGPTASSRTYLAGGWTGAWQGSKSEEWFDNQGDTILEAFRGSEGFDVSYSCGVNILGGECDDVESKKGILEGIEEWVGLGPSNSMERAVEAAKDVDAVIVCVGEEAYAEKPGDIRSLDLPAGQYQLVRELKSRTSTKIVLVYIGGRPRLLQDMTDHADAVVIGFLPGPWGGPALANLISGKSNFSGKLPITYPIFEDNGGVPYFHSVSDMCNQGEGPLPHYPYVPCAVQWPFGHGLSYTTFSYSNLEISGGHENPLKASVTVTNTGSTPGADVVFFFTFDEFRSATPEYKRLRAFVKVRLNPGQSENVMVEVPAEDLKFIGPHDDTHYVVDATIRFHVGIGANTDCRENPESDLCSVIEPKTKAGLVGYETACDSACSLWERSGCAGEFGLSKRSCLKMCGSISSYPNSMAVTGTDGWGWNYVGCLESVIWGMQDDKQCWKMTSMCRDIFKTGSIDEFGVGPMLDPANPGLHPNSLIPNLVAVFAAVLSAFFMARAVGGGRLNLFGASDPRSAIQFSRISTQAEQ